MTIEKITGSKPPLQVQNIQKQAPVTEKDLVKNNRNDVLKKDTSRMEQTQFKKEDVEEAVTNLNDFIKPTRTNLKFELHDKLERYYVKVIDSETEEVVKEIPPEKMLDMYAAMAEFMGFLIDKKI